MRKWVVVQGLYDEDVWAVKPSKADYFYSGDIYVINKESAISLAKLLNDFEKKLDKIDRGESNVV